jgi:2'-5' RNA ligase
VSDQAFLAVDLNNEERHALAAALTEANPGRRLPGRKTQPENWHITLRFLGECTDTEAEQIMNRLSETVDVEAGRVWCVGLDAFPKRSKAGVLHVSIDDPDGTLQRLAMWCDEAAVSIAFKPEDRPYVPHLTLSRARPAVDVSHTFQSWDDFRVRIGVRAITLFRTRRTHGGLQYEPVDSHPLS